MKKLLASLAATVLILGFGAPAQAAYPEQPIMLICPWGAGGGTDAVARIVATLMQKDLGVPINVVNRTGGSGVTGHQAIRTAKADGYTIGIGTVELAMMHWMGLTDMTVKDFSPIGAVNFDPAGITVAADAPWATYKDYETAIKANPGKFKNSGTGMGGIWHLAQGAWLTALGLSAGDLRWIPTDGAAQAIQELMAGGVDSITCSLPEAAAMLNAKRVRALAIMADERDPNYPEVPTLKELGVNTVIGAWRGILAPKDLPRDIQARLEDALAKVVESKEFTDFMKSRGYGIHWIKGQKFGDFMIKADEGNGVLMKAAGLTK